MIKLIALDIDGTLFNSKLEITPATKAALMKTHDQGITLMLASGRTIHGLRQLALRNGLPLDHMVLIGSNGAVVAEGEHETVIYEETMDLELARTLIKAVQPYPVTMMIPRQADLFVEDPTNTMILQEVETECLNLFVLKDLSTIDFKPNKVILTSTLENLNQVRMDLEDQFKGKAVFMVSGNEYIDLMIPGLNKGTGIKHYCELTGIDLSEVIAFGDNYNDLDMIKVAGIGVAMGNAVDALKEVADRITDSNDNDGIAKILQEYL